MLQHTSRQLWSFDGRMGRAAYVGYNILNTAMLVAGTLLALALGSTPWGSANPVSDGTNTAAVLLVLVAAAIAYLWAMLAVVVKRLHDLDLAGINVIWILLIGVAAALLSQEAPALSTVLNLCSLGLHLWLIFAPGTRGPNRFGAQQ